MWTRQAEMNADSFSKTFIDSLTTGLYTRYPTLAHTDSTTIFITVSFTLNQ